MSILVDTGAWYAVTNTADRHHQEAGRFFLDQAPKTTFDAHFLAYRYGPKSNVFFIAFHKKP